MLMATRKSIARHTDMITVIRTSSDSNDHKSLGADQEHSPETQPSTHNIGSSSAISRHREGVLHNEIHLPKSTRLSVRTTFQYKFVFPSQQHVNIF